MACQWCHFSFQICTLDRARVNQYEPPNMNYKVSQCNANIPVVQF